MDSQKNRIYDWNALLCAACFQIDCDLKHREILEHLLDHHNQQKVSKANLRSIERMLVIVNNRLYHNSILAARCRLEIAYLEDKLVAKENA